MLTDPASATLSERLVATVGQAASPRATPGLYLALLRLLASGEPVTIAGLAAAAGHPTDTVQEAVARWNDTLEARRAPTEVASPPGRRPCRAINTDFRSCCERRYHARGARDSRGSQNSN
jgi:hypothetical protein